jgi:hypothetical protein
MHFTQVLVPIAGVTALTLSVVTDARAGEAIGATTSALVYDGDTRQEAALHPDPALRWLAETASAALVLTANLRIKDGRVQMDAPSLADDLNLCARERFDEQPVLAECSGVLVARDLVLTAGHCVDDAAKCDALSIVFGYAVSPEGTVELRPEQVFPCAELVARERSNIAEPLLHDYALLRLGRSVPEELVPATVRARPVFSGEPVALIGNGLGLPTKIDGDGRVTDARSEFLDYFGGRFDLFHRGSGSGVFDVHGMLLGIAVRGGSDFEGEESCLSLRSVDSTTSSAEEATYAANALSRAGYAHLVATAEAQPAPPARGDGCSVGASHADSTRLFSTSLFALVGWLRRRRVRPRSRKRVRFSDRHPDE